MAGSTAKSLGWSATYSLISRFSAIASVPLVLGALEQDLYAVWVMAGAVVFAQGLIDLGMGAALIRYTTLGTVKASRSYVRTTAARAGIFYLGISLLVGVPLAAFAGPIVSGLDFLQPGQRDEAAWLVRYAAITFALTNATLVLSSIVQGLNRVDASYRAQALGWALYVPTLAAGLSIGSEVHAVGLAWVVAYSVQVLLLAATTRTQMARLGDAPDTPPSLRDMFSLGGRWQVSSWADFSTFQLPRLITPLFLSSGSVVAIDLAMRYGQLVVTPVFIGLPLVLPRAAAAWEREGVQGLRKLAERFRQPMVIALALGTAVAIPLSDPVVRTWTGRNVEEFSVGLAGFVVVGLAAHASTGLLSSALLSAGRLRPVLVYKARQLVAASVLVSIGALVGPLYVGAAIAIALGLPAVAFNRDAARALGMSAFDGVEWRRLVLIAVGAGLVTSVPVVVGSSADLEAPFILAMALPVALAVVLVALRSQREPLRRGYGSGT
jgi:O-antigen/teichoic acid export membrane protein